MNRYLAAIIIPYPEFYHFARFLNYEEDQSYKDSDLGSCCAQGNEGVCFHNAPIIKNKPHSEEVLSGTSGSVLIRDALR